MNIHRFRDIDRVNDSLTLQYYCSLYDDNVFTIYYSLFIDFTYIHRDQSIIINF